jgi:hypothetical protein
MAAQVGIRSGIHLAACACREMDSGSRSRGLWPAGRLAEMTRERVIRSPWASKLVERRINGPFSFQTSQLWESLLGYRPHLAIRRNSHDKIVTCSRRGHSARRRNHDFRSRVCHAGRRSDSRNRRNFERPAGCAVVLPLSSSLPLARLVLSAPPSPVLPVLNCCPGRA